MRTPLVVRQAGAGWGQQANIATGPHDIGVVADVPVRDWSTFVRPHHWGYWAFGLSRGFAFEWWLNWALAAIGPYALLYVLTRRVTLSAALGLVVAAAPSVQWWTNSFTGSVIGYTCLGVAALILALRQPGRSKRWIGLIAFSGWMFACAATIPYPAWVVPLFIALAPVVALAVFVEAKQDGRSWRERLITAAAVGGTAAVMSAAFLFHHRAAVQAISQTVYPGHRSESGGGGDLVGLFGSPYYWYVARHAEPVLVNGTNESEAAGPLMLLLPAVVAYACAAMLPGFTVVRRRAAALLCGGLVLFAWFVLPIPAGIGRLVLLTQVPPHRLYHTLAPIGAIAFGMTTCFVGGLPVASRRRIAAIAASATFAATATAGTWFTIQNVPLPGGRVVIISMGVASLVGVTLAGYIRSGAIAMAVLAVVVTLFANPLQHGLGPLTDSPAIAKINAEAAQSPGVWWVSTSDSQADIAVLTASQAPMISGPSVYPNVEVWLRLDPNRSKAASWNSYSHVIVDALPDGATTTMWREADILHLGLDLCGADAAALKIGRAVLPPGDPLPSCTTNAEQFDGPEGSLQLATIVP